MTTLEFLDTLQTKHTLDPRAATQARLVDAIRALQDVREQAAADERACSEQQLDEQHSGIDGELAMLAGFFRATAESAQRATEAALRSLFNVKGVSRHLSQVRGTVSDHIDRATT